MEVAASNGLVTLVIMAVITYVVLGVAVRWVGRPGSPVPRGIQKVIAACCIAVGALILAFVAVGTLDGRVGIAKGGLLWPAFVSFLQIAFGVNVLWEPWRPFR